MEDTSYGTAYFGEKACTGCGDYAVYRTFPGDRNGARQPMPVSEQVTELHHTEVWKNIFPRYNKMAQIQK